MNNSIFFLNFNNFQPQQLTFNHNNLTTNFNNFQPPFNVQ